ncbi:MAG: hypothetical protein RJB34_1602 [Pseudomonadota bacterium]
MKMPDFINIFCWRENFCWKYFRKLQKFSVALRCVFNFLGRKLFQEALGCASSFLNIYVYLHLIHRFDPEVDFQ